MTPECFKVQMARLRETFGAKAFTPGREQIIGKAVRSLTDYAFEQMVSRFISEMRQAPLPKDFLEAAAKESFASEDRSYALGEIKPRHLARCHDCGDSGFIRLRRNEVHESWARYESGSAPCRCARGKDLIEAGKRFRPKPIEFGPQFNSSWLKSYSIVSSYKDPA